MLLDTFCYCKPNGLKKNKTENPFSLQNDECKIIRSPMKPYGILRAALRNPRATLISNETLKDTKRQIFYKKGDIVATTITTTITRI